MASAADPGAAKSAPVAAAPVPVAAIPAPQSTDCDLRKKILARSLTISPEAKRKNGKS